MIHETRVFQPSDSILQSQSQHKLRCAQTHGSFLFSLYPIVAREKKKKEKEKDSLKRAFTGEGKKVSDSWRSTKQVSCTHSVRGRSFTAGQLGGSTGGRLCVLQTASPPGTD